MDFDGLTVQPTRTLLILCVVSDKQARWEDLLHVSRTVSECYANGVEGLNHFPGRRQWCRVDLLLLLLFWVDRQARVCV